MQKKLHEERLCKVSSKTLWGKTRKLQICSSRLLYYLYWCISACIDVRVHWHMARECGQYGQVSLRWLWGSGQAGKHLDSCYTGFFTYKHWIICCLFPQVCVCVCHRVTHTHEYLHYIRKEKRKKKRKKGLCS